MSIFTDLIFSLIFLLLSFYFIAKGMNVIYRTYMNKKYRVNKFKYFVIFFVWFAYLEFNVLTILILSSICVLLCTLYEKSYNSKIDKMYSDEEIMRKMKKIKDIDDSVQFGVTHNDDIAVIPKYNYYMEDWNLSKYTEPSGLSKIQNIVVSWWLKDTYMEININELIELLKNNSPLHISDYIDLKSYNFKKFDNYNDNDGSYLILEDRKYTQTILIVDFTGDVIKYYAQFKEFGVKHHVNELSLDEFRKELYIRNEEYNYNGRRKYVN